MHCNGNLDITSTSSMTMGNNVQGKVWSLLNKLQDQRNRGRMSVNNRFWIIACLATWLFLVVEGKSLRHSSQESAQISDKKQTVHHRIRLHRHLQGEEEPASQHEANATVPTEAEESVLDLETNATVPDDQGITTKAGETGSSPFYFGTGDTSDENLSPFIFGPQQPEDGGPQAEAGDITPVNLNATESTSGEDGPYFINPDTERPLNDTMPSSAQLDSEQPRQEEYADFHFGSGQIHHQQGHSSNHMNTKEGHQGSHVDGDLVDQFANMFDMVHISSGHLPPPNSGYSSDTGYSSKGKGSIYYDEFGVHGKGGKTKDGKRKGKGAIGKGSVHHSSGRHSRDSSKSSGGLGSAGGKKKLSKKSSSSGSKAYRREHRLTMPPKETNSYGASSEKSRR